jgi:class 3 adenylate cyclase
MIRCQTCSFENASDAKFCENCGKPLERACPNCAKPVSTGARFCKNCGFELSAPGLTPAPAKAPPAAAAENFTQALIDRYTTKEMASKIAAARQGGGEGERRIVTILFADIKGSTALAEKLDPEDWAEMMNHAFEYLIEPIYRYEGIVARLMGDAILAFFGAPVAHEDDPQRGVLAALAILEGMKTYREKLQAEKGLDVGVRIGLNTGLVVVGNVGSDLKSEYTAMGDAINLASRMQTAAEPNTILISENTYRLITRLFEFEDRGQIAVKGKEEPIQTYRPIRERKGATRQRGIAGLQSPMVGRESEYAQLRQVIANTQAGRGAVVAIIGEAGLGKSRLIAEWRKAVLAEDRPVRWIEGRCLSYGTSMAHHLSTDILRGVIGAPAGSSEEETRAALKQTVEALLGAEAQEVHPFLGHLLGVKLEDELAVRVKYLDGPALQARYISACKRLLEAAAQQGPVVIVCEDVHWADASSVELGLRVLPSVAQGALVVVFVSRPDPDSAGWKLIAQSKDIPGVGALELHLSPLSENDSRALVNNLLEIEALPESLRTLILAKAEGNPFFVEEVIRMLIDRGGLTRQNGQWTATREINTIEIPDTLHGVLTARIDRLPEEAKRTLQIAAVIGRKFQVRVLEKVLEQQGL